MDRAYTASSFPSVIKLWYGGSVIGQIASKCKCKNVSSNDIAKAVPVCSLRTMPIAY